MRALFQTQTTVPLRLNFPTSVSDEIKKKVRHEFKYILEALDFDKKGHEIFRNWYIDGRLYYNKVIDQKRPEDGIQELRYIDAQRWSTFVRLQE